MSKITRLNEPPSIKMKEKKRNKIIRRILVSIGICCGLFGCALIGFVYLFLFGGPPKVIKDENKYVETMHKYTQEVVGKVHTGFFTFPQAIPESAFESGTGPVFYFSYQDTWDDPTCEVYLKCTYSDEDYAKEIDRLKNSVYILKGERGEVSTKLEFEKTGRFAYPVYKAIDCDNHSYEYAMDLGENEIAYIYTSFKDTPGSLKKIPKEYLPDDYEETIGKSTFSNGGCNVYVTEETDEFKAYDYGERF